MKRLLLGSLIVLSAVLTCFPLTAQNAAVPLFTQLADTQFGAFTNDRDFTQETINYEFAVANINRLKPAFVVICGDLINKVGDPVQTAEYHRITAMFDKSIPVYPVSGNHDVGNEPTAETLAYYRQHLPPPRLRGFGSCETFSLSRSHPPGQEGQSRS